MQPPPGSEPLTSLELVLGSYGPSAGAPTQSPRPGQTLSQLGQTPRRARSLGQTLFPKPRPRKITGPQGWNQAGVDDPGLKGPNYSP